MNDEPELYVIKLPDLLGDEGWAEQEGKRAEGRRRYIERLVPVLAATELANDLEEQAGAVLDALLRWDHVDSGERCHCACHPRLPEGDFHDYGFDCPCCRTIEERTASFDRWLAEIDEFWESPEGRRIVAAREAEEEALATWLVENPSVAVRSHGGMADLELLFGRPLDWCPACGMRVS